MNLTLAWLNLLGDVRQLPFLGIYVIMFFDILKTFLRFGIVFIIFIVAFGLGFHLLLINQTPFQTVGYSLLKTSVMMTGEFEYESIFHNDTDQLGFSNLTFVRAHHMFSRILNFLFEMVFSIKKNVSSIKKMSFPLKLPVILAFYNLF